MKIPFVARRMLIAIAAMVAFWQPSPADAQTATGEANFNKLCGACHTVGGGRRVGPDLSGVGQRRSEDWLLKFIASSQKVIKEGDPTAVALFEEYNKTVMPDAPYSPEEIKGILAFIAKGPTAGAAGAAGAVAALPPAAPEEVRIGQMLFHGSEPFANGGPACASCHHVEQNAVIGGGVLAKELTTAAGRMGADGVRAIVNAPPFPVMEQAYKDHALTEKETLAVVAYLRDANARNPYAQPREDGIKLAVGGFGGLIGLLAIYGLIWRRRKQYPVNKKIFARQVQSQ